MGFEILDQINRSIDDVEEPYKLRITAWNGVIFNCVLLWAEQDFRESPRHLAARLTEFTHLFFDVEAPADRGSET